MFRALRSWLLTLVLYQPRWPGWPKHSNHDDGGYTAIIKACCALPLATACHPTTSDQSSPLSRAARYGTPVSRNRSMLAAAHHHGAHTTRWPRFSMRCKQSHTHAQDDLAHQWRQQLKDMHGGGALYRCDVARYAQYNTQAPHRL